ncbi:hypothetical protein LEP1GSC061_0373 [Leptospira wolffii serovar Khorat str. Khorat-H2]|nr:hypothetical protein LEP1GSC061_0373 [Leptospira wolffii serovar Khorat str. Khorat-H2]
MCQDLRLGTGGNLSPTSRPIGSDVPSEIRSIAPLRKQCAFRDSIHRAP